MKLGGMQVVNEGLFRAYVELINRRSGKHVPNSFLQEVKGLHENTALNDLDGDFRKDFNLVSTDFLTFLNFNGFKLVPKD